MGRPAGFQHKSVGVKQLKETMQSGHRTGLPGSILEYFAPRPMLAPGTPLVKKKQPVPFQGVAHCVPLFAGPQDPEEVQDAGEAGKAPRLFRNPELALQCRLNTETKQEKWVARGGGAAHQHAQNPPARTRTLMPASARLCCVRARVHFCAHHAVVCSHACARTPCVGSAPPGTDHAPRGSGCCSRCALGRVGKNHQCGQCAGSALREHGVRVQCMTCKVAGKAGWGGVGRQGCWWRVCSCEDTLPARQPLPLL